MYIDITHSPTVNVEHRTVELVERKGIGHPDTLCDRAAEELSIALSRYYREHFGAILHHNTDKALLVGGRAHVTFGGGEVLEPMYLLLAGRATLTADGHPVPVESMATGHTADWLRQTLPHVHLPHDLVIDSRIRPSSPDLLAVFSHPGVPLANDTSMAVAFAPFSELERIVKAVEGHLNSPEAQARFPQLGQDIKVMGMRVDGRMHLSLAVAFVAAEIPDLDTELDVKETIATRVTELAAGMTRREVHVSINTADRIEEGAVYLTVTGTSAEQGDDGEVGRGNRATGLITPMRPMTLEAAAGKNPVSHVGKLYQVYAQLIVDRLCAEIPEIRAASCTLLSHIGAPINDPRVVAIRIESQLTEKALREPIVEIVQGVLDEWASIRDGFLHRRWPLF
ncbi:MAG: methionine adenosyltransferase [Armatimonadota bacterium]